MTEDASRTDPAAAEESLPVVSQPSTQPEGSADVWGVVLAAGTSTRFEGRNKLLQTVGGQPLVRHAAEPLLAGHLTDVVVVVGHEAARVGEALAAVDVRVAENPDYGEGQSTSVRTGVDVAQRNGADAVLVALGDMPSVSVRTVARLVATYESGEYTALAAAYRGDRGNPVLFDAAHFDALRSLSGDVGGREILLTAAESALVETDDPGVRRDVDSPGDVLDN
ncbi:MULTISPECIES: nucleotidyltransferase family protein [Salinibaculum]|uniref:nucleotidyltransferase family protein n=1 Tax=Salinibaculum TaxID=2732368 RepID=UPI0030D19FE4